MLSQWNIDFAKKLFDVLNEELLMEKNPLDKLFSVLIQTPLESLSQIPNLKPIVIVIDALDECEQHNRRNDVLAILAEHFLKLPAFVKMIITSRPEDDIIKAFNEHTPTILKPSDEQNLEDLKIYSENFLRSHKSTTDCIEQGPEILVKKSEGLFVWLVLACTSLYEQLGSQITLQQVKDLPSGGVGGMDKIFETTFQRIFSNIIEVGILPIAIQVLEVIVISRQRLSSDTISNLLQLNTKHVNFSIRLMQSVLKVDMHDNCIQVFHKSVVDYITNPKRCEPNSAFFVNTTKSNLAIVTKCLECLNKELRFNICNLHPGILHKDIPDFDYCVSNIPEHLVYASKFWITHALQCHDKGDLPIIISIGEILDTFTTLHLLHWVELLSLCGNLSIIQVQLPQLISQISMQKEIPEQIPILMKKAINDFKQLFKKKVSKQTSATLLKDIKQLVGEFFKPISQLALHVYSSALVLCPEDTGLFKKYYYNFNSIKLPKVITGKDHDWSSCLATFEGHNNWVNGVAWWTSIDGEISLIASVSIDNSVRLWDAFTGIEICQFLGHSDSVNSIAFSKDGTKLVSGSTDKSIKIWDIET
ncbi:POC1 centriolar protein A, partial [Nowakowskiella sp. JEL0078]